MHFKKTMDSFIKIDMELKSTILLIAIKKYVLHFSSLKSWQCFKILDRVGIKLSLTLEVPTFSLLTTAVIRNASILKMQFNSRELREIQHLISLYKYNENNEVYKIYGVDYKTDLLIKRLSYYQMCIIGKLIVLKNVINN